MLTHRARAAPNKGFINPDLAFLKMGKFKRNQTTLSPVPLNLKAFKDLVLTKASA